MVNASPPPALDDDESDLGRGPMQLVQDNGDTSADGDDMLDAAETAGGAADDLLG